MTPLQPEQGTCRDKEEKELSARSAQEKFSNEA